MPLTFEPRQYPCDSATWYTTNFGTRKMAYLEQLEWIA